MEVLATKIKNKLYRVMYLKKNGRFCLRRSKRRRLWKLNPNLGVVTSGKVMQCVSVPLQDSRFTCRSQIGRQRRFHEILLFARRTRLLDLIRQTKSNLALDGATISWTEKDSVYAEGLTKRRQTYLRDCTWNFFRRGRIFLHWWILLK